jgi:hypothetical protein
MAVREEIVIGSKADTRGFKQAENAATKLNKTVKSLAGTLGIAFSTVAVIRFGKASVNAFLEAEKANIKLANSVKNLGLVYAQADIQGNLDAISAKTGIAGEILAEAFQGLLTTTGSLTKSFELLNLGLDVAAGTSSDLTTVTQDLANGYIGVTRGLRKYNLGLSQTQLKLMSFEKIQAKLNEQYSGSNAAFLDTYAGKMQILGEAAGNAQERVGLAIIDLGAAFTGSNNIDDLIGKIDRLTDRVIGVFDRFTEGIAIIRAVLGAKTWTGMLEAADQAAMEQYNRRMRRDYMKVWEGVDRPKTAQQLAAEAAAERAAKKRAAEQLKATKALTAEQKKQAALKKAGTVFDIEQIQAIAALKGNLSKEERLRVEAMLALMNENDALASKLTKEILMAQDATGGLYRYFLTIGDAKIKNPFAFLDEWIIQFQDKLNNLKFPTGNGATATVVAASTPSVTVTNSRASITSSAVTGTPFGQAGSFVDSMGTPFGQAGSFVDSIGTPFGQAPTVIVNVAGSVIAEQDLTETISRNLQNQSLSTGKVAQLDRYSGFFL